jgi:NAD+ kinase
MSEIKIHIVASNNPEAKKAKSNLSKLYKNYPVSRANVIVALGGDGLMLQTLHDNIERELPIYGMNRGSIGFLMNNYNEKNLLKRNEVSLLRETYQAAKLKIYIDGKERLDELVCDGLLLSTPAGSTAYNLSAHGPILPLTSNLLALTPISAFRPRRWKGALLPRNVKVKIVILEKNKRPVSAVADNSEFRNIEYVEISENKDIQLKMLFDPKTNLEERIINEQFIY